MPLRPPRLDDLKTEAGLDRWARGTFVQPSAESVDTGTIAGAPAASNDRFYVKRAGALSFDVITLADLPAGAATDAEVATAIADHEAAADPHPQYLLVAEGDARYRELTDAVTYAEITGKPAALALIFSGTGTPEGNVTAGVGSTYHRTDGGAGTSFYVKESGTGTTGWVAK